MPESAGWILDFYTPDLSQDEWIAQAGGKGANLARLAQAGLPVPHGFIVRTAAYHEFAAANDLEEKILAALPDETELDTMVLEDSSHAIRAMFSSGRMPASIQTELVNAYSALENPAVAIRSSANAEDTLELSFAGQQDTWLNVVGIDSLIKAVVDCWSSLWTARAIGYRAHNHVPHTSLALAVVVQKMVHSQVSGVLFTANPLTGLRSETVIDAAYGLGEALVSGKVEPDQYIVDTAAGKIGRVTLGSKAAVLRSKDGGGTVWEAADHSSRQALTNDQILALARLGKKVEALYNAPQDIEWALVDDRLHLLQSRPVTSLFPIPAGLSADPLKVLASFAAVQGLMAPITPLGRDSFRYLFALGGRLFGMSVTAENQTAIYTSGERIWINITSLIKNTTGRKVTQYALGVIEPTVGQALAELLDDPRLQPERQGISWKGKRQLARFAIPVAGNFLLNMVAPEVRRAAIVDGGEKLLAEIEAEISGLKETGRARLKKVSELLQHFMIERLPFTFLRFVSGVAAGKASLNALNKLAGTLPECEGNNRQLQGQNLALEITRGMKHNPTTEMDMELWKVALAIRSQPALEQYFSTNTPQQLGRLWKTGEFDQQAARVLQEFLERYGSRGLAEIDIGRTRWREDPTPVFSALSGYLQIEDSGQAPDTVFERGEISARAALDRLVSRLRATRGGWIKAPLARFFAGRMRRLLCIRESPKFFAVRIFGLVRRELLRCGQDLVSAGELGSADDLFFLTFKELEQFSDSTDSRPWMEEIANRRHAYDFEQHRRQIPRLLLSDGRAFYTGIQVPAEGDDILNGSPVSPGSVEGLVRVVLDPHHAGLLPGEIMVCPGTDPSWTPLFLTTGGLIMEVGGMMTHGAVVAREYGIPAVVGVDQATRRLQTGMRIRLDGSSGQIVILP